MRHFKSQAPWRDCRMWTALGSGSCVPRRRSRVLGVAWGICDLAAAGAAAFAAGTEYCHFGSGHGLISWGSRLCLSFSWCPAEQRNADYLCTHIARLDRRIVGSADRSKLVNWATGRASCQFWVAALVTGFAWLIVSQLPDLCGPIKWLMYADAMAGKGRGRARATDGGRGRIIIQFSLIENDRPPERVASMPRKIGS